MADWLVPLLSVVVPVVVTGLFNIWLFRQQTRKEAAKEEASTQKIMAEAWQMVNAELKMELTRLKEDRDLMRIALEKADVRIAKLEEENLTLAQTLITSRENWRKERESMYATIANLKDGLRKLGKTTAELKSDTDQIKTHGRGKNAP